MSIDTPSDLFRRLDEFKRLAECEQRTEDLTIAAVVRWLRGFATKAGDDFAYMLEIGAWKPPQDQ